MMITASLATLPDREDSLRCVVDALLPQVDQLYVRLNGHAERPAWLHDPKLIVSRGPNLGDRSKFDIARVVSGYHVVCDDDLVYPPDYVERLVAAIERYGRRAVVGVLGTRFSEPILSYHRSRYPRAHTTDGLRSDWPVHVLGTGTIAYHADAIRIAPEDFLTANMADVWFAIAAKRQGVPLIAIARPAGWIGYLPPPAGTTIYDRYVATRDDTTETAAVRTESPWPALTPDGPQRVACSAEVRP